MFFDVRRRRGGARPYGLARDNGGSETRGDITRRAEVHATHTEYDVLKHIDVALAAINVHLAVLLPPFSAWAIRHSNRSAAPFLNGSPRTARAIVGFVAWAGAAD